MNWTALVADETLLMRKHFTPGRAGRKISFLVIHHNAGNLTTRGCYDVWQTRQASAHYQVERNGKIGQLVNDWDTAWHAGDSEANYQSIGIEHANLTYAPDWTISPETLDNGAHLVAALCKAYKLGEPKARVNVFPHSKFVQTSCPGAIFGNQLELYMQRARNYYNDRVDLPIEPANPLEHFPRTWPLRPGQYFGDINGDENSVGGFYIEERKWIKAIQRALILVGVVPVIHDPYSTWADGLYEKPTIFAVKAFQEKYGVPTTGTLDADGVALLLKAVSADVVPEEPTPEPESKPNLDFYNEVSDTAAVLNDILNRHKKD